MSIPQHVYVSASTLVFMKSSQESVAFTAFNVVTPTVCVVIFPAHTKPARVPSKSYSRGVVFEDIDASVDSTEDDDKKSV